MISDISRTLRAILDDPTLPGPLNSALKVFNRPDESFNPDQSTINLFLYDIHENVELRSNEPRFERQNAQVVVHPPPLRITCSYLITAWPVSGDGLPSDQVPLEEQHLLSQILKVLSMYPTIPTRFLQGSLIGQELPVPMVALHPDALKNLSEFWTALGIKIRPSITVTITIALDVFATEPPVPIVITEKLKLGERTSPDEEMISSATLEDSFRIGGTITDATDAAIPDATVSIVGLGLIARTDGRGRYSLGMMKTGTYTLRVQSGTATRNVTIIVPTPLGSNYNVKL
jgi:hypothetical protein